MSTDASVLDSDIRLIIDNTRALVSELYDPANAGNPTRINFIQEHLQALQRGPHAWLIANDLLSGDGGSLRFFGALTFTVKINHDWKQLSQGEVQELLGRLIDHYVGLASAGEQPLVIRKLASTLVTIFLSPGAPWTNAIRNLAASLANGKYITESQCQPLDLEATVLPAMSESQVVSLLYFSSTLAEEVERCGADIRAAEISNRVSQNAGDAFSILQYVLSNVLEQETHGTLVSGMAAGVEAITCYQSWMSARGFIQLCSAVQSAQIASVTSYIIQSLRILGLSKAATQVLLDQVDWRHSIVAGEQSLAILEYITSDFGTAHITSLMDGDFDNDHITFLNLLLTYSTFKQREILAVQPTENHEKVLSLLHTLLKVPGYAAVDDSASPLVVEWWTEAADNLQDLLRSSEDRSGFDITKHNLARATLDCFKKLIYPEPEELRAWSDEDRSEFSSFRRDVCDFLLAVYPMLGVELIQLFQVQMTVSLTNRDWRTFEAAVFCIAQLSEAVDENKHADDMLNAIFFNDEFARLCADEFDIPYKARQTLVDMLGQFESYFERTQALLPRVLTFLFASLDIASCAPGASKSISHLCQSCRKSLTVELSAFMDQFESFRFKPTASAVTMERVLEGIAAIIQALDSDKEKAKALERILRFFREQAELARDEAKSGTTETACARGQFVLRCVASIGKGLRRDGDVIDLNDDDKDDPYPATFWNTGSGAIPQRLVMECMQLLIDDFPFDITIVEAACNILKAGYTEKSGPYVFPPALTINFVKSIAPGDAGADIAMRTASAFLASHASHPQRIYNEASSLVIHVYESFFSMHERPESYDPEVANSGIDFLTRLLPKYHPVLFTLTSPPHEASQGQSGNTVTQRPAILVGILNYTLLALQSPEPLPLRAASQFWATVLTLPRAPNRDEPDPVQSAIENYLPTLCRILITQISGKCARSDIEHLNEVLRKIIFKYQGPARAHLADALARLDTNETDQNKRHVPSPEERERFLASLFAVRGAKAQTRQLSRSFWVRCRGTVFDYAE